MNKNNSVILFAELKVILLIRQENLLHVMPSENLLKTFSLEYFYGTNLIWRTYCPSLLSKKKTCWVSAFYANVMSTSISILTETHRPVLSCKIVHSWLTEGIGATGVRVAQVSLGKWPTWDKRVSCMCLGTGTDSFVTSGFAISTKTTGRSP